MIKFDLEWLINSNRTKLGLLVLASKQEAVIEQINSLLVKVYGSRKLS